MIDAEQNLRTGIRKKISNTHWAMALLLIAALPNGCRESRGGSGGANPPIRSPEANSPATHTYSTAFSKTENPISENRMWANGSDGGASIWAGGHIWHGGRLWGDVQTSTGFAFGVDEPTKFGDPSAILTGAWGPTQTVTGVVRVINTPRGECCHEVELRMRTAISQYSITGYEAYCSVMPDQPYCHIARWNGPNGSYWNFETGTSEDYVKDGDVMMATARGSNPTVITLYKNGKLILQATDSGIAGGGFGAYGPFPGGNPGIGFFDNRDSNWKDFGFASFTATDDPNAVAGSLLNAH